MLFLHPSGNILDKSLNKAKEIILGTLILIKNIKFHYKLYNKQNLILVFGTYTGTTCLIHTYIKLDRVGPVDNRPSTNLLCHFVKLKKKIKKFFILNVTHDM